MDYEVVVIGTGLAESITAAALSRAGFSVAHVDPNVYYGGLQASLSLDEFVQWADAAPHYIPHPRQYSISLAPSIIPSVGPLISSLISSGVSRYTGFKLLDRIALYGGPGFVTTVPATKEDIFKNKLISLVEKRRLMRFFTFAVGEFEGTQELDHHHSLPLLDFLTTNFALDNKTAETITYALAFCTSPSDPTLPALRRIRRYLRSGGRYGPSPFLVGHYGSSGEIAQGFCRTSAVNGTTYILGRAISSLRSNDPLGQNTDSSRRYSIILQDFEHPITCDLLISSPRHLQDKPHTDHTGAIARCVAIIDRPLLFSPDPAQEDTPNDNSVDTAVLIFPPSCLPGGGADTAVHAFVTGQGTMSAPESRWILYLSTPVSSHGVSAEELLQPYLTATMSLSTSAKPLFTLFYVQRVDQHTATPSDSSQIFVPPAVHLLSEGADAAAEDAEAMFHEAVKILQQSQRQRGLEQEREREVPFWPPLELGTEEVQDNDENW